MKPLIYLASPYSHPERMIRHLHFRQVCEIAGYLMSKGELVFSPIAHTHSIAEAVELPVGFEYWKEYDTRMLVACDELWVLCLDGWEQSLGVRAEIDIMLKLGKPIRFIKYGEILQWQREFSRR